MLLVPLLLILQGGTLATAVPPINIEPLPDGVSVRGGESLKIIDAAWHVYVTLDPPTLPHTITQRVLDLSNTFATLEKFYGTAIKLDSQYFKQTVMLNKLNLVPTQVQPNDVHQPSTTHANMSTTSQHKHHHKRSKRGLLNVGGKVLNWLFGVATTEQLDRYKSTLQEVVGNQKSIAHAFNSMATILNQTKKFVENLAV